MAVAVALLLIGTGVTMALVLRRQRAPQSSTAVAVAPSTAPSASTAAPSTVAPSTVPSVAAGPTGPPCYWLPGPRAGQATGVGMPPVHPPTSGAAVMTLTTNRGVIEIGMDAARTPCAIASFNHLAGKQFFNGSTCHRLVNEGIWVLQCGDPTGTGMGDPGYAYLEEDLPPQPGITTQVLCGGPDPTAGPGSPPLPDGSCPPGTQPEVMTMTLGASQGPKPDLTYHRGSVAIANTAEPGTSGCQFFFSYRDNVLPAAYTPLGTVTKGMDIVDAVAAGGLTPENGPTDGRPKLALVLQTVAVAYT